MDRGLGERWAYKVTEARSNLISRKKTSEVRERERETLSTSKAQTNLVQNTTNVESTEPMALTLESKDWL